MNRAEAMLLILLVSLFCCSAKANSININGPDTILVCDTIGLSGNAAETVLWGNKEVLHLTSRDSVKTSRYKSKKLIAAILSFPVPFGLLGLHRVFLGTKPYIPFVYIGTLGGCFFILPIIDFIAILSADEDAFMKFENNPKVFMWPH